MKNLINYLPHYNAEPVAYATSGSVGIDLPACIEDTMELKPNSTLLIPTGISLNLFTLINCEAQIRSRSGLALKYGVIVLNSPGTIDKDYTGEVKVILHNTSKISYFVEPKSRIAQMVFCPVAVIPDFMLDNVRGDNGFGSTGV